MIYAEGDLQFRYTKAGLVELLIQWLSARSARPPSLVQVTLS